MFDIVGFSGLFYGRRIQASRKRLSGLLLASILCLLSNSAASARDLLETYQLALKQDPVFQSQVEQFKGLQELESEAFAGMLPTITASGTGLYQQMDINYKILGEEYNSESQFYSYGVTLEQPIFVYEKWVALDQADISVRLASLQMKKNELDLMLRVSNVFFTAIRLRDDYDSLLLKQSTLQSQSFYIQKQVDVGHLPKTELLQVKSLLEMATAQVYSGRNRYQAALEELYMLTGEAHETVPKIDDSSIELLNIAGTDEGWLKLAQDNYLGIKIQQETVNLKEGEVELTKSGHYPTVKFLANYTEVDNPGRYGYNGDYKKAAVLLSVPIFAGGGTVARTRKAHHEWNSAKLELDYSRRDLKRNVSNALHSNAFLQLKRVATRTAVIESESAFHSIVSSYRAGKSALIGLIKTLDDLHLARLDYHRTVGDLILNYLTFHSYVGDLSSADIKLVNGLIKVREETDSM